MPAASIDYLLSPSRSGTTFDERAGARPRRVLVVSPHFPPINAADHHRVRLALPHFAENGWTAEVLAVRAEDVEGSVDFELEKALPIETVVHRVKAISAKLTRRFGVRSLALRAYQQLRRLGDRLLSTGQFDLVFFSTTQFGVLPLGPYWKRRYGVPYVIDFQDEWTSAYYRNHPKIQPPGGRVKYAVAQWLAQRQEPEVVAEAAQILSVSPRYIERLRAAYPRVKAEIYHELPFGGAEADFAYLDRLTERQTFFDSTDGRQHWVYVGRGGEDMHQAVSAFFSAVRRALDGSLLDEDELRIHFLGTSYAPGKLAQESFAPLARAHGLEKIVTERAARMPYFTALRCLREAHALIVPGSDDPGYTASKIYPYIFAQRPLLTIFHERSSAVRVLRETQAGTTITFTPGQSQAEISERIFQEWIVNRGYESAAKINFEALEAYSAMAMTRRLSDIFNAAMSAAGPSR